MPSETLGSRPGSVVTAATGRSVGRRTIGPASFGLRWAWQAGMSLSHRAPATPVAGRAQCALTKVRHIGVAGFQGGWHCVKKQCGLVGLCIGGRMTFNLRLSPARMGVIAMRQDCSYKNNWIPRKGGQIFIDSKLKF